MIEIKLKGVRVSRSGARDPVTNRTTVRILTGDVTVKIDDQYIARVMGRKALLNRSRKSVALGVVARATNVKEES